MFDVLPSATIDNNGHILQSNSEFKKYIYNLTTIPFRDLFTNVQSKNNTFYGDRNGVRWLILFKQYGSKYKVWCTVKPDEAPSIWATIPMPMLMVDNELVIRFMNLYAKKHFPFMHVGDLITKYYPTVNQLIHNTVHDVAYDGVLSKINIYQHSQSLWLFLVKSSGDIAQMDQETRDNNHLKAIGQITSSVIHDFRNILSAVRGYCELILEANSIDAVSEYLQKIISTTDNANSMVLDLLRFAKSRTTGEQFCSPAEVVTNLFDIIDKIATASVKVTFDIRDKIARVGISASELERVILNLVINAKDSITSFGSIQIRIYKRYFAEPWTINDCYLRKGFYITIVVVDSGCGMSEETLNQIFIPFFTTKKTGNGLGLSTTFSMVKDVGGAINVLTQPGIGTGIFVYLPIVEGLSGDVEDKIAQINTKLTRRIAIVEDNEDVLRVCKIALEKDGHTVFAFPNGEKAEKFLEHNRCDLLITDANLPGISGLELVEKLKNKIKLILVISGYDESILGDKFPQGTSFLCKPIPLSKFREKVYNLIKDEH